VREGLLVLDHAPTEVTPFGKLAVNWEKTKVWSEGGYYARVFFNVKGREPKGKNEQAPRAHTEHAPTAAMSSPSKLDPHISAHAAKRDELRRAAAVEVNPGPLLKVDLLRGVLQPRVHQQRPLAREPAGEGDGPGHQVACHLTTDEQRRIWGELLKAQLAPAGSNSPQEGA